MAIVQAPTGPMIDQVTGRFRWGWIYASVWLIYLGYPLAAAWGEPNAALRALGIAAILTFGLLYIAVFIHVRRVRRAGQHVSAVTRWGALVVMAALLVMAAPAASEGSLVGTIYIAVLAVLSLPGRQAWTVVGVLVVGAEALQRFVPGWSTDTFFAFQLLIAAFAAWGVSHIIDRNAALAAAQAELAELAVIGERERLARDVHDLLGHSLTVITVKAELAGRLLDAGAANGDPDPHAVRARAEIDDIEGLARDALADVRATVSGYREVTLAGELASARSALAAAGIEATLPTALDAVPGRLKELFGWAVREGVTNVIRHSQAERCTVRVGPRSIEVLDDGRGVTSDGQALRASGTGHGLDGLRERAIELGARLVVGRSDNGGFRLRIVVDDVSTSASDADTQTESASLSTKRTAPAPS